MYNFRERKKKMVQTIVKNDTVYSNRARAHTAIAQTSLIHCVTQFENYVYKLNFAPGSSFIMSGECKYLRFCEA